MSDLNYNGFLAVKILSIGYYSMAYFFFGSCMSIILNYFMKPIDPKTQIKEKKLVKIVKLFLEILLNFALIGMSFYFIRKIVKNYIPNPLDTLYGFDKNKLKEIQGGIIIATSYMTFQTKLVQKLSYLKVLLEL
jgi:hypothetical protein